MKYLLFALLLTSCQSPKVDHQIYQPETLILKPNTRIETAEGVFVSPNEKQVWHSQKSLERLEKIISNL